MSFLNWPFILQLKLHKRYLRFAVERYVHCYVHCFRWSERRFPAAEPAEIQYLTKPREVFAELQRVLKPGGMAVVAFSHRSFIEKARFQGRVHAI